MIALRHALRLITAACTAWLCLPAAAQSESSSRLSSRFLARGEQALLEISVSGTQPTDFPLIPSTRDFDIKPAGTNAQTRLLPGRRLEYVFEYLVSGYQVGRHEIPAFEIPTGGARMRTEPIEFNIFNPDDLTWNEATVGVTRFRYASAFRAMNATPYEGETTPVEIKLYVPRDLFVEDWGIPDFQRDGLTAWRFQPSAMRGQVNLLGMPYLSVAYPSTLTPTRQGQVGIGPASVRLITTQVVMDGILRRVSSEVHLQVDRLELNAKPLPPNAPEGFENAVGSFRMDIGTNMTEFQEGDPIPVEIIVSGSGNLDTLRPPKPIETDGWKVYDATPETRGSERHDLSGNTVFKQFLRPLEVKPSLPAFRLVYFDPKENRYQTITSDPIPLQMKPAAVTKVQGNAPPQALPLPLERMTDILGLLEPAALTQPASSRPPAASLHLLGALAALALIAKALWMRHGHRFQRDPVRASRLSDLRDLEKLRDPADAGFLLAAGRFIERWLGDRNDPEIRSILAERDANCFRPETSPTPALPASRRQEILRLLRKASLIWVATACLFFTASHPAQANESASEAPLATQARTAYDEARYNDAIRLWLQAGAYESLAPDTLYNIGNACYRAGSPGHAALYYRRTLARAPQHAEARQNLRFLERKYGAITIRRPDYQYALAKVPLDTWKSTVWASLWLTTLALLAFPATRPGARIRPLAIAALVIAPLIATSAGLAWRYYPNDAQFSPLTRQAVITASDAVLHAEASRTSPEVIDAPPGSLCEIIRHSGRWSYVAFATKTRGWILTESIDPVIPTQPPTPPRIRKPKADDSSA